MTKEWAVRATYDDVRFIVGGLRLVNTKRASFKTFSDNVNF